MDSVIVELFFPVGITFMEAPWTFENANGQPVGEVIEVRHSRHGTVLRVKMLRVIARACGMEKIAVPA